MTARGIGVRELARSSGYTHGHISDLRNGRKRPSPEAAQDLDDALGAGGELAALASQAAPGRPRRHVTWDDAAGAETVSVPCRTPDGRIIFVTVPRRTFLQGMGAAAALGAVGVPLSADAGRPAERFLLARRMLRDVDNLSGPRDVIPLAARQVAVMRQLSGSARGGDLRELVLVQIQFADLLGWLYQDCGDYEAARHWLDRALEWSHVAGEQDSVAFILARKSQLAGDMRDPAEAVALAEAAIRQAGPGSRLGAVAATYASHGYAIAGDRAACDRLCEQARSALDAAGGSGLPWAQFFDEPYIDVHHARSLTVLGDCRTAAERFRAALSRLQPAYYRDRGVYLAREATAYAGAGEAEHAAGLGAEALAIGIETRSGRIFAELADLEQALAPAASASAVARFRTAMDAAVLRPA